MEAPERTEPKDDELAKIVVFAVFILLMFGAIFAAAIKIENDREKALDAASPVADFAKTDAGDGAYFAASDAPVIETRFEAIDLTVTNVAPGALMVGVGHTAAGIRLFDSGVVVHDEGDAAGEWRLNESDDFSPFAVSDWDVKLTVVSVDGADAVDDVLADTSGSGWKKISLCDGVGFVSSPHFTEAVVSVDGYVYRIEGNEKLSQRENDEAWALMSGALCFEKGE